MGASGDDASSPESDREKPASQGLVREAGATLAIVMTWVAALFAAIGTGSVAKRVFGRSAD